MLVCSCNSTIGDPTQILGLIQQCWQQQRLQIHDMKLRLPVSTFQAAHVVDYCGVGQVASDFLAAEHVMHSVYAVVDSPQAFSQLD